MAHSLESGSCSVVARDQLRLLESMGLQCHLTADDQRRLLALSEAEWSAWRRFLRNGPLPSRPRLPDMLHRVAVAAHGVAFLLDPDPVDGAGRRTYGSAS